MTSPRVRADDHRLKDFAVDRSHGEDPVLEAVHAHPAGEGVRVIQLHRKSFNVHLFMAKVMWAWGLLRLLVLLIVVMLVRHQRFIRTSLLMMTLVLRLEVEDALLNVVEPVSNGSLEVLRNFFLIAIMLRIIIIFL